jgi:hypothetical protein
MSTEHLVPPDLRELYQFREWRNAAGVLSTTCPDEWADATTFCGPFGGFASRHSWPKAGLPPIPQQENLAIDIGVIRPAHRGCRPFFDKFGRDAGYGNSAAHHDRLGPRMGSCNGSSAGGGAGQ